MARDDRLKKVQGVGADFLETARARAEEFLRELSRAGGDTQERAQGALDDLVEGGRKGTEQLVSVIRREITTQLSLLGLATKDDLAELERRLSSRVTAAETTAARSAAESNVAKTAARSARASGATTPAPATSGTARRTAARKTAEAAKTTAEKTGVAKTAARKSPAKKAAATKKPAG